MTTCRPRFFSGACAAMLATLMASPLIAADAQAQSSPDPDPGVAAAAAAPPATPPPAGESQDDRVPTDAYRLTEVLLWFDTGFAGAHITEGFLGRRTFSRDTTATVLQATYLTIPASLLFKLGPIYNIVMTTATLVPHAFGHYNPSSETALSVFYRRWTDDSNTSEANRLGVRSPAVGRIAQGILVGFDAVMLATLVSSIRDGVLHGFTLTERRRVSDAHQASFRVVPDVSSANVGLDVVGTW